MTFTELKNEVAALGFENRHFRDSQIAAFAKRAQSTIFSDRAITKTVKIFIPEITPSYKLDAFRHRGGEEEVINISGACFAMELCGVGTVRLEEGGVTRTYSFNSDKYILKGFIPSMEAKIIFGGPHSFFAVRLLVFKETYGESLDSIPDTEGRVINKQAKSNGDFLCFCSLPCDKDGKMCSCICMEDGEITFPAGVHGEFYVTYRRAPIPPSPDLPLEKIDIPKQCEHLLTLLTAAYICLEYDTEQAKIYKESYERQMRELNRSSSARMVGAYHDVTGWA